MKTADHPLRVLMIVWEYPPVISGGLGIASGKIGAELQARSDVELVILSPWCGANGSGIVHLGAIREPVSGYTRPYGADLWGKVADFRVAVLDWLRASPQQFDVVYSHDWLTVEVALAARPRLQCRWVWHVHSLEADRRGDDGCRRIASLEKTALALADGVIAVSRWHLSTFEHLIRGRKRVVWHGVDVPATVSDVSNEVPRIGFVGRCEWQKGMDIFYEIAREWLARGKAGHFVVYGEGTLAGTAPDFVEMRGFLSHDELLREIASLDLLLVPSRSEPFGLVVVEAAAAGVPVIVSDRCGARECFTPCPGIDLADREGWISTMESVLREGNQIDLRVSNWLSSASEIRQFLAEE